MFLERTKEGHCQSHEHWDSFKGNVGKTFERRGRAHKDFSEKETKRERERQRHRERETENTEYGNTEILFNKAIAPFEGV